MNVNGDIPSQSYPHSYYHRLVYRNKGQREKIIFRDSSFWFNYTSFSSPHSLTHSHNSPHLIMSTTTNTTNTTIPLSPSSPTSFLSSHKTTILLLLTTYLLLVHILRYSRRDAMLKKFGYTTRESLAKMTNTDAQAIMSNLGELEFPRFFKMSLQFALFKVSVFFSYIFRIWIWIWIWVMCLFVYFPKWRISPFLLEG